MESAGKDMLPGSVASTMDGQPEMSILPVAKLVVILPKLGHPYREGEPIATEELIMYVHLWTFV